MRELHCLVKKLPLFPHLSCANGQPVKHIRCNPSRCYRPNLEKKKKKNTMDPGLVVVCAIQVLLLLLVVIALVMYLSRNLRCRSRTEVDAKTVLVLNCDSLPGYHIAKYLDQLGLRVIAACSDTNSLPALWLHTDVSPKFKLINWNNHSASGAASALKQVQESIPVVEKGLWALVLPVAAHGSAKTRFEYQAWSECMHSLHNNLIGPLQAIHTCIPLLKRRQGRVITLSEGMESLVGKSLDCVANGALQGLQSSLRQEVVGTQWAHVQWTWDNEETSSKDPEGYFEEMPRYFEAIIEDAILSVHPHKNYQAIPSIYRRMKIARQRSSEKYKNKLSHIIQA